MIAHVDCDAFFASVEKKLNPELENKPVIVGFGQRGVVSTACYIARIKGVKSAMPMFKALQLCPDAVIVKPRMGAYAPLSQQIKAYMEEITPFVNFVSVDEAYLDFTGTYETHNKSPARLLVGLTKRVEAELGLTCSVGLSYNRFLAKIASNLNKPKGFAVFGNPEIETYLPTLPLSVIPGVGKSFQNKLNQRGYYALADIKDADLNRLEDLFGSYGTRLWHLARGIDYRRTKATRTIRSISNERTFMQDIGNLDRLEGHAWRLTVKVSDRAKERNYVGKTVVLKLKQANHKLLSRQTTFKIPTNLSSQMFPTIYKMLEQMVDRGPFRLLGIGLKDLMDIEKADHHEVLFDPDEAMEIRAELVGDEIRKKFGHKALIKGRGMEIDTPPA